MSRWYSDIFKFQAAYSQGVIDMGLCVVPMGSLAKRIDSNVVSFERCARELPSAQLSITLPILLFGIEPDSTTSVHDVSMCAFGDIKKITGVSAGDNRFRIVNGLLEGVPEIDISPSSPIGPRPK